MKSNFHLLLFDLFLFFDLKQLKFLFNCNLFHLILVPPLYIHIQGLNHPLTSGVKVHLSCSSAGARPIPQIVWTKNMQIMQGSSQSVSCHRQITKSTFQL